MENNNVKLRKFKNDDYKRLAQIANNKNISNNLRDAFPHPYTEDDAKDFIAKCHNAVPQTVFAIEYYNDYVGNIGLMKLEGIYKKTAEIGYFIGEQYWNKGIATKAVKLIVEFGFTNLDIVRIHTGVYDYNTASQKVLEKCGFIKEAIFEKAIFKNYHLCNEIRYAMIKPL